MPPDPSSPSRLWPEDFWIVYARIQNAIKILHLPTTQSLVPGYATIICVLFSLITHILSLQDGIIIPSMFFSYIS